MSGNPDTDASILPGFEEAVFISYTHVDNQPFGPEDLRWISHLHEQLTSRVQQLFGDRVTVWRDDKLQGNDVFPETLADRLANVAVLVSVCSPRYLNSEWCLRELNAFIRAAEAGRGLEVGTKSRIFKVLKTPVPLDELPDPLEPLLGYEFYEETEAQRRIREFLLNPDPEERWKFYARTDDLAQDIAALLHELAEDARPEGSDTGTVVYLADTTSDVAAERDAIKRELERRGHEVLPRRTLPLDGEQLKEVVTGALTQAELSIHLLGDRYGTRPETEDRSIPHLQLDLATQLVSPDGLKQLIWIPDDLEVSSDLQAALIDELQVAVLPGREVVRSNLEAFKAHVLEGMATPPPPQAAPQARGGSKRIYLVYDVGDRTAAAPLRSHLESLGHTVMVPLTEGSETEAREVHEMSMVFSDAVIIHYGNATEHWVRMKLFDLIKAPGWGRTESFLAKAVWLAEPSTAEKADYRTNEAMVIDAKAGFDPATLEPFLTRLESAPGSQ